MTKTFCRFFTIADYEDEEVWLREQANKGYRLVKTIIPCFYVFEECEPEDVIYRLDFKNNTQTPDYMRMLEDYGWEYCGECMGWLYFRKPYSALENVDDGELFSDNLSRVEMAQRVVKTRLVPICIIFFCCLLPNLLIWTRHMHASPLNRVFGTIFSALFILYVYLITYCGIKLKKIRDKYKD